MSLTLNTVDDALAYWRKAAGGYVPPDLGQRNWAGMCQSLFRRGWGSGGGFASAKAQWYGADPEDRHTGPAESAPVGAGLCFLGGTYGHIMGAARPFRNDDSAAWSNDLVVTGDVDKVGRMRPVAKWGQQYVGWVTSVNGVDLRLGTGKPPKPKQNKRYKMIARSIDNLEVARETALRQGDREDARLFTQEIRRLKGMYEEMRRA